MYPCLHQYPDSNQSKTIARIPLTPSFTLTTIQAKRSIFVQSIQENVLQIIAHNANFTAAPRMKNEGAKKDIQQDPIKNGN
jgi:hypothetical protein